MRNLTRTDDDTPKTRLKFDVSKFSHHERVRASGARMHLRIRYEKLDHCLRVVPAYGHVIATRCVQHDG